MTKTELINDLESKSFVGLLTILESIPLTSEGINLYAQHYIEIVENVAKETKAFIFVLNEGTENEVAYYKDREPTLSAVTTNWLVKKYKNAIDSVNGTVLVENDNFIIVEGYQENVDEKMEKKRWFANEINGVLNIKEILLV